MRNEDFSGESSFTIETRFCRWATIEQPALREVGSGEPVNVRLWYFSQATFTPNEAHLLVAFGESPVWRAVVPLPTLEGGLLTATVAAPRHLGAAEPIRWHLANHGVNSWNMLEVSLTTLHPCPGDGGAP